MGARGQRGRVIEAGPGGCGRAWIAERAIDVVSHRGGPLACGDLVRIVAPGAGAAIVEVVSGGATMPLLVRPGGLRAAHA